MKRSIRVLAMILLVAMVAGMLPTFAIAEEATKGITLEKEVYEVGEDIIVNAMGTGKDWVGLYLKDDKIGSAADGGEAAIHWYYAEQHPTLEIKKADQYSGRTDLADIPVGEYKIVLLENDGYNILDEKYITVVPTTNPNAYEDEQSIELAGGQGAPFGPHGAEQSFAVRYNVGSDRRLASVNIFSLATYSAPCQQITYRIYQWDSDYDTTVAGKALFTLVEKDHADNAAVAVPVPCDLNLTGDLLFVMTCDQADTGITPWQATGTPAEGATFFDNGVEGAAFCISVKTAKALPKMDPTYIIDFTGFCEDVDASYGFNEKVGNNVEYSKSLVNGYVTFKAPKKDPYVWIRNGSAVKGLYNIPASDLSYVVVKYRTNYDDPAGEGNKNTGINLYTKVKDGEGETGWKSAAADTINDSMWHTVVIDGSEAWGAYDAPLTLFRFDPMEASNGDGIIGKEADIAYIAFFQNKEAAERYAAAEEKKVAAKGELNWGDPAILCLDGEYYTAATVQVLGEDANINSFRLLNENNKDTGLTVLTTDDGRKVAVDYLIPLTYQDPLDGALEIDGKKYTYEQKIPVSMQYNAIDPEDNSKASEEHTAAVSVTGMSPDSFLINGKIVKDGGAHTYISQDLGGKIRDTACAYESVGFRGWAKTGEDEAVAITHYGYALNDGEIVWNESFVADGSDVKTAGITGNVTRYVITIDMATVSNGWHYVYLFAKDASGSVYRLNVWGDFLLIKGGELVPDHYADNNGNSYPLDSLIYTEGEQAYVLQGAVDVTNGIVSNGYDYDNVKETFVLDIATKSESSNRNQELANIDPLTHFEAAGYDEGPEMIAIYGDRDYVKFDNIDFSKYQRCEIIIGTDTAVSANIAVGFVTDKANIYGQDINNMNLTSNIAYGIAGPASEGEPNLSGHGGGAGWNSTERRIVIDLENVDYNGPAYMSISTTGGSITIIAKVTFYAYEEDIVRGKYTYDTEVSYVAAPKVPVDPAEVIPVYILDGEGLNPTGDQMRTDTTAYDYEKGCIRYTAIGGDPNSGASQIPAGTTIAPFMVFKYRTEVECKGELFTGSSAGAIGGSNIPFPSAYIADGEWHYMVVDLRASGDYDATTNVINHFRNDYVQGNGEWVEIEYYAFFDSYDKADYYGAHDLHELPQPPKTFKATFVDEDGTVIKEIEFKEGATKLTGIPKPPSKDGYTSKWESYTLADADITIKVVYTEKVTEPATDPATEPATEPATDPVTEPATEPATDPATEPTTDPATEADTKGESATVADATDANAEDDGCASVVVASGAAVLMAAVAAAVALRKKKD